MGFEKTHKSNLSSFLDVPDNGIKPERKKSDVDLRYKNPEEALVSKEHYKKLSSVLTPKEPKASYDFEYKRESPSKERKYRQFDAYAPEISKV